MRDDAVTESISHFIGLFSLTEEQFRLRLEYDHFRTKQAKEDEQALLDAESRSHEAPLDPGSYQPELDFKAPPQVPAPETAMPRTPPPQPQQPAETVPLAPQPLVTVLQEQPADPQVNPHFSLPAPSSMAAVVVQQNVLSDNDVVGADPGVGLLAKAQTEAAMAALEDFLQAVSPFHLPLESLDGDWFEIVETLVQTSEGLGLSLGALPGAVVTTTETGEVTTQAGFGPGTIEVTLASGSAAQGFHLDGLRVNELPEWTDLLPDLLREEPEEETAEADGATGAEATPVASADPAAHDFSKDFEDGQPGIDAADLGHHVTTGGNMLVNETAIQSTWLDAKVFVVGGDYQRVDAISQTNVIVERDSLPAGAAEGSGGAGEPGPGLSQSHNIASIETISRVEYERQKAAEEAGAREEEPEPENAGTPTLQTVESDSSEASDISVSATSYAGEDAQASEAPAPAPGDDAETEDTTDAEAGSATGAATFFPTHWAVTTISGDLIQFNWSEQTNFVSDSDTVSFSFSASSTTLGTGENLAVNGFFAWELGFQYDLILVGGNMIDTTIIKQINILLDSDRLEVTPAEPESEEGSPAQSSDPEDGAQVPTAEKGGEAAGAIQSPYLQGAVAPDPSPTAGPVAVSATCGEQATTSVQQPTAPAEPLAPEPVPAPAAITETSPVSDAPPQAVAEETSEAPASPPTLPASLPAEGTEALPPATESVGAAGHVQDAPVPAAPPPAPPGSEEEAPVAAADQGAPAETAFAPLSPAEDTDGLPASPAPDPAATATAEAPPLKASLADNMLVNQAKITTVGEDLQAEMDDAYRDTLKSFQDQKEAVSTEVLTKAEFAGTETLRVLYVEKDFKTVNVVQQTNVLGDDDTVKLAIDEFAAGLREEMEVTMGSNALANLASVKDSGMDSKVMAAGETYSDALLHQAEFVMPEMPEMPDLMAMKGALATEAVAFLSDDMMGDAMTAPLKSEMFAPPDMPVPSADIMQSMLA